MLDSFVVEQTQGLERVYHAAEKHPKNPVLSADTPWERAGNGPYLYGTVLLENGKFRLWYHGWARGHYQNLYAESTDGIVWKKPHLGIVSFDGSKENNLLLERFPDTGGDCHNPCVIPNPDTDDPDRRYLLFTFDQAINHGPRMAHSPDGLNWTFPESTELLFRSSDVVNFCFDPYRDRFVSTWKLYMRRGRSVGVAWTNSEGEWVKPIESAVITADDLDPDTTQIYGMPLFAYQGLYIGLPWVYHARYLKYGKPSIPRKLEAEKGSPCTTDVQLAWSWDLLSWTRPARRYPFSPRGAAGEFDSDMIYTARAPVVVGDRLYFYYGGMNRPHNVDDGQSAIGLATMRLDGFCSLRAGDREGWLVGQRESFHEAAVTINARTAADGYVVAEIVDEDDQPLAGFSRADSTRFVGDTVNHVFRWSGGDFSESQRDEVKKVRFYMKRADLYSYIPHGLTDGVYPLFDRVPK